LLLLLLLLAYYHHHYHYYLHLFIIIIIILFIYFLFLSSYSLLSLIFEIFDLMLSNWVSFLTYPNLFGIKDFVVVVVAVVFESSSWCTGPELICLPAGQVPSNFKISALDVPLLPFAGHINVHLKFGAWR
jgi:hypothetical protein